MKKTRIFLIGGVAMLLVALVVAYFESKPKVTITMYGLKWDSDIKQIGLTPLTDSQSLDIQARFAAARKDANAAYDLFIFYRGNAWPASEIPAPCTFAPGVFSCNAPDGPAIATYLDKEGNIYYKFAMIKGATTINIGDRDGMWLLR